MPRQIGAATAGGPPAPPQQPGLPPGAPPQQLPAPGANGGSGLTNVDAAAGPLSPNATASLSPENAMASMLRMQGGVANGGGGG
jgi:hypothetical protein